MSTERDLEVEMRRFRLDDHTCDRLLDGNVAPEDAPPGFERLAHLVQAATGPAAPGDLAHEGPIVAAMTAAVRATPAPALDPGKKSMLTKLLSAKVAAIAATMVIGATAAAAATNSLPDPAQSAVSNAASHVGLSVPSPDDHGKPADHQPGNGKAHGPDATGNAKAGLCHAYASGPSTTNEHDGKASSVAFQNLAKAASDAGQSVDEYCADTTSTTEGTDVSGDTGETEHVNKPEHAGKSEDAGKHGTAGESEDHATVTTPNSGGTSTDDGATHDAGDDSTDRSGTSGSDHGSDGSSNSGTSGRHSDDGSSHG
jgi:hypothetical protein